MVPPNLLLAGQRAVIGGEALNATFGPSNCPPTNSATSNAAASKLPPITAKKPMLDFWCAISRSCTTTTQGVPGPPQLVGCGRFLLRLSRYRDHYWRVGRGARIPDFK